MTGTPVSERIAFVVGAQRSGTKLLQRMLSAHPGVVTLPSETQLFHGALDLVAARAQHGPISSPSTASIGVERDVFLGAMREFCDRVIGDVADRLRPGAQRIVERSPNHAEHLDLIAAVYPKAWALHIIRDGRDVTRSILSQRWGPSTIGDAAALWARTVRGAREAGGSMQRYLEIRYEDLLAEPDRAITTAWQFLGLDTPAEAVTQALAEADVPVDVDHRHPVVGAGKWRDEWTARDLREFESAAGDLLDELGYPRLQPRATAGGRRRGRLRSGLTKGKPAQPGKAVPYLNLEVRQRIVDSLCAALIAGEPDGVPDAFTDSALVRIIDGGDEQRARAGAGRDLLRSLMATVGPMGRQRRGDVHPAGHQFTVILDTELAGQKTWVIAVVEFADTDRIRALTIYRVVGTS